MLASAEKDLLSGPLATESTERTESHGVNGESQNNLLLRRKTWAVYRLGMRLFSTALAVPLSRYPFVSVSPFVSVHKGVTIVWGAPIGDPPVRRRNDLENGYERMNGYERKQPMSVCEGLQLGCSVSLRRLRGFRGEGSSTGIFRRFASSA